MHISVKGGGATAIPTGATVRVRFSVRVRVRDKVKVYG